MICKHDHTYILYECNLIFRLHQLVFMIFNFLFFKLKEATENSKYPNSRFSKYKLKLKQFKWYSSETKHLSMSLHTVNNSLKGSKFRKSLINSSSNKFCCCYLLFFPEYLLQGYHNKSKKRSVFVCSFFNFRQTFYTISRASELVYIKKIL